MRRRRLTGQQRQGGGRQRQGGLAAVEFAMVFPLLLLFLMVVLNLVMMFAARQSLATAAAEGARAALQWGSTGANGASGSNGVRKADAQAQAYLSMQWLESFGGSADAVTVYGPSDTWPANATPCASGMVCYLVVTSYNYGQKPLMVGMNWLTAVLGGAAPVISEQSVVQLDAASAAQVLAGI